MAERVILLGGPFNMQKVELTHCPQRIELGGQIYTRINDPDTGESLGGYALGKSQRVEHFEEAAQIVETDTRYRQSTLDELARILRKAGLRAP